MPEVKDIIHEMLERGMSEEEVLATLKDIGIENPEAVLREALETLREVKPPAPEGAPTEEWEEPRVVEEREVPAPTAPAEGVSLEAIDAKLDEAVALLKALQDINKKVLEANRDILLRLKK